MIRNVTEADGTRLAVIEIGEAYVTTDAAFLAMQGCWFRFSPLGAGRVEVAVRADRRGLLEHLQAVKGEAKGSPPDGPPLGLLVEYDLAYTGGEYTGVGEEVWISSDYIEACGGDVAAAFQKLTGFSPLHIVHYSNEEVTETDDEA